MGDSGLDELLRFAALIVKFHHSLGGSGQVGEDESDRVLVTRHSLDGNSQRAGAALRLRHRREVGDDENVACVGRYVREDGAVGAPKVGLSS